MRFRLWIVPIFILLTFTAVTSAQKAGGAAKPDPAKDVRAAFVRLTEGIRQADAEKVMSV